MIEMNLTLTEPFFGDFDRFRHAIVETQSVLYLVDTVGEMSSGQSKCHPLR
jgi:uncharacterized protein with ATP-grasp and redox domains